MVKTANKYRYRYVPFITLSLTEPETCIWITLSDCNFKCKGCFSIARDAVGEPMTVDELINWVEESNRAYNGDTRLEEACLLYTSDAADE